MNLFDLLKQNPGLAGLFAGIAFEQADDAKLSGFLLDLAGHIPESGAIEALITESAFRLSPSLYIEREETDRTYQRLLRDRLARRLEELTKTLNELDKLLGKE